MTQDATCACVYSKHLIVFSFTKSFSLICHGKPGFLHCIFFQRNQPLNATVT